MTKYLFTVLFLFGLSLSFSQSILGKWKTIDDETGKEKSIVEIYERNGKVYGKIIKLINPSKSNPTCSKCEGSKKDAPILNPENGKEYKCRLKIGEDKDTLQVRGYVAFFYKTQYWKRVSEWPIF